MPPARRLRRPQRNMNISRRIRRSPSWSATVRNGRLVALLSAVPLAMSCVTPRGSSEGAAVQPPIVAAARVSRADFRNQLTLTAEFEPFQDVDVMAKVSGYVHAMRVD